MKNIITENHNGREFTFKKYARYVIDEYDEYLQSIEQSHYEDNTYKILINYGESAENSQVLDLTWMKEEDIIRINPNSINPDIKEIRVNINNIDGFALTSNLRFNNPSIIVFDNKNIRSSEKIMIFQDFIKENQTIANNIKVEGFGKVMKPLLEGYINYYKKDKEKAYIKKRDFK